MGKVNDSTSNCTQFHNNSVIIDGTGSIVDTQCGIRCAGRYPQTISWERPSSSRLTIALSTPDRPYSDLIRTGSIIVGRDEGIYTCRVGTDTHSHIGIYVRSPGEMHIVNHV